MERYLRPLAIAVVIIEVCAAFFTVPVLNVYLFMGFRYLMGLTANGLSVQALLITGTSLTFVMGILAVILAAQRGHRRWSIAFGILLALFAYSPLLLTWVLESSTSIYDATTFTINTNAVSLVQLSNLILPAIILAVVVLVYSLHFGRARDENPQGQDAALQLERSRIDNPGAGH